EVTFLLARPVATVLAEQLDLAFGLELVELVEGHARHPTLVLLARAVDIEVSKADNLAALAGFCAAQVITQFAPHPLVEQQLGIAVHVERPLELGRFTDGGRARVGWGATR